MHALESDLLCIVNQKGVCQRLFTGCMVAMTAALTKVDSSEVSQKSDPRQEVDSIVLQKILLKILPTIEF